jgi:hypothetical protein
MPGLTAENLFFYIQEGLGNTGPCMAYIIIFQHFESLINIVVLEKNKLPNNIIRRFVGSPSKVHSKFKPNDMVIWFNLRNISLLISLNIVNFIRANCLSPLLLPRNYPILVRERSCLALPP